MSSYDEMRPQTENEHRIENVTGNVSLSLSLSQTQTETVHEEPCYEAKLMPGSIEYRTAVGKIGEYVYEPGKTIWQLVEENKIPHDTLPTICLVNGEPTLRKDWTKVIEHESVIFVAVPRGDFFKGIIQLVASIALAIFAPFLAGIIGPIFGFAAGGIGQSLIAAGIVIAGSFLLQALFPPQTQKPNDPDAPSPTYSLDAQGNSARLMQPIPKLYGKHIIYPDFAAQPYSNFVANQQYLYQLFSVGLGEYDIEEIRIEDTKVWDSTNGLDPGFAGIEIQIVEPGDPVTLFYSQVVTSIEVSSLDMRYYRLHEWFSYTSDGRILGDAGEVDPAVPGDKLIIPSGPNAGVVTVIEVGTENEYLRTNTNFIPHSAGYELWLHEDTQWVGPYTTNPADTIINKIELDFFLPKGLYYANDEGRLDSRSVSFSVQARQVTSAGLPAPGAEWQTIGSHEIRRRTLTPQRLTYAYDVTDGRYEVRVKRTTRSSQSSRIGHDIQWGAMRGFVPNDQIFNDVTLLAMKMLVTGQLSQTASRRVNVIQTAKLPVYNGTTWTLQNTRSIAWAAYDIATNEIYGGKYPPSSVDLSKLLELDTLWTTREDYFDAVFDTQTSVWDALSSCLRVGRAHPIMIAGQLSFKRRGLDELPRCVFTPENIVRNSFEVEHILFNEDSADDVIVEFLDNRTWERNEVLCALSSSSHLKPERMQLFGITDRLHAWREGIFTAAYSQMNRIVAQFSTELIGRILSRGDYIIVGHDLFSWGQSGIVEYYTPATRVAVLNRDVEVTGNMYVMLRRRNGSGYGPVKISQGDFSNEIVIDAADLALVESSQGPIADVWALEDDNQLTNFIIQTASTTFRRFTLVSGTPSGDRVDLVCIIDDSSVHSVDQVETPPGEVYPYTPTEEDTRAKISTFTVVKDPGSSDASPIANFSWSAAVPAAASYILQISYDGFNWDTVFEGTSTNYSQPVFSGILHARVAGVTAFIGQWKTFVGNIGEATLVPLPTPDIDIISSTQAGTLQIYWEPGIRASSYIVELRTEFTVDSGVFDVLIVTETLSGLSLFWTLEEVQTLGGPWKNIEVQIYSVNNAGASSAAIEQLLDSQVSSPSNLKVLGTYNGSELYVHWDPVTGVNSYTIRFEVAEVTKKEENVSTNSYIYTNFQMVAHGGPWRDLDVYVVAHAGDMDSVESHLDVTDDIPEMVDSVIATQTGAGQLTITWDPVIHGNLLSYAVHISTSASFVPSEGNKVYEGLNTTAIISGLSVATHYIRVAARDTFVGTTLIGEWNYSLEASQAVT